MKRLARRLGLLAVGLLLLFVILRAIVVPLARQRYGRRELDPNVLSLLPAGTEQWVLRRGTLREAGTHPWPESASLFEARLNAMDLPLDRIKAKLGIGRIHGGEWLGARGPEGRWLLLGPLTRLPQNSELVRTLTMSPDTLLLWEEGVIGLRGGYVEIASAAASLHAPSWLETLPAWLELTDLLVGSDWLEYRRCGEGGAVIGAKAMMGVLLCEGFAWDCREGPMILAGLEPGPALLAPAPAPSLDSLPGLRHSAPFGPDGAALLPAGSFMLDTDSLRVGERRWERDGWIAAARVLQAR